MLNIKEYANFDIALTNYVLRRKYIEWIQNTSLVFNTNILYMRDRMHKSLFKWICKRNLKIDTIFIHERFYWILPSKFNKLISNPNTIQKISKSIPEFKEGAFNYGTYNKPYSYDEYNWYRESMLDKTAIDLISRYQRNIRYIDLTNSHDIDGTDFRKLEHCTKLEKIKINCINISEEDIIYLLQRLENLIIFTCDGVSLDKEHNKKFLNISDNLLFEIAKLRLKKITLKNCNNITDNGLEHLAKCLSLEKIKLQEMPNITSDGILTLLDNQNILSLKIANIIDPLSQSPKILNSQIINKILQHEKLIKFNLFENSLLPIGLFGLDLPILHSPIKKKINININSRIFECNIEKFLLDYPSLNEDLIDYPALNEDLIDYPESDLI